jgi:hypothetical protein
LPILLGAASMAPATTLREAVQAAGPANGYDRWVELQTGEVYTGGLQIGPSFRPYSDQPWGEAGQDVRIVGNGAILDLQGQQILVSYCNNRLDIDDCVILGGGVRFRGYHPAHAEPVGSVRHVTFWRPHDYGVRMQNTGPGITVERNIIVDAIDTGLDFIYLTGIPSDWMPTGTSITGCVQSGSPVIHENWSYHEDPGDNLDPLAHFSFL